MLRRVAVIRTDVSEELSAFIIRITRIGELATTVAVNSNRRTLRSVMMEAISFPETSVLNKSHTA
jgi:hypothetical protein